MKIGEVIGAIRKNKNLKSKDVYKGILSRPAISRFEKGHSDTTTDKFFQILDNLNLSLEISYRKSILIQRLPHLKFQKKRQGT